MLKMVNLFKNYKEKIVYNNYDICIEDGEMIAIKGNSGSGKTTLIRILSMQDRNYRGQYFVDDMEVSEFNEKKYNDFRLKKMSVIFQNYNLINYMTVFQNIVLPLKFNHISYLESDIERILEEFNMLDIKDKRVDKISGGEAQRTAIIRALVMNTKYIFADEPTGNLDDVNTKLVMDMLKTAQQSGHTIIMVTHSNQLDNYFDRIIRIEKND